MFPKEVRWEYQILKKVELKEKTSKAESTWLCISADGTKLHVKKKKKKKTFRCGTEQAWFMGPEAEG